MSTSETIRIFHFDDNPYDLQTFTTALAEAQLGVEFIVESFSDLNAFSDRIHQDPKAEMVVLDIKISGKDSSDAATGFDLAELARSVLPFCVIAMRSSADDAAFVSQALKAGADDFISKSSDKKELAARTLQAYLSGRLKRTPTPNNAPSKAVIGNTAKTIRNRLPRLLQSAVSAIHVYGESGTGKEVVADLIQESLAANIPFVRVNCGAIPPTIMESELFGHIKGAFTGALNDRRGLVESADGGWLFLDEIATLSTPAQIALLRVIENGEVRPLGATKSKKVDIRIVSATNESLEELVKAGKFRKDLWQRLCDSVIELPPLRNRKQEIPDLISYFAKTMRGGPYRVAASAVEILSSLDWRNGNIRELRNCLRAMSEYQVNGMLTVAAIPSSVLAEKSPPSAQVDDHDIDDAEDLVPSTSKKFVVELPSGAEVNFENFSDILFLQLVKHAASGMKRISQRSLAKYLNLSRSAVSDRLKRLIDKGFCSDNETLDLLNKIV